MSVTTSCPGCQHRFDVHPAELGRSAKCPSCRTEFQAQPADGSPLPARSTAPALTGFQAGAPPAPARGDYETMRAGQGGYGGSVSIADVGGSWSATMTGLRLVQVLVVSFVFLQCALLAMNLINPALMAPRDPTAIPMWPLAIACGLILIGLVGFVGMCLCCTAPYPPARSRALTSVLLIVGIVVLVFGGSMVLGVSAAAMGRRGPGDAAVAAFGIGAIVLIGIVVVLSIVFAIVWILFHMAVADYFQAPRLRSLAVTTLVVGLILTVLTWLIQGGAALYVTLVRPTPGVALAATVISFLFAMVNYAFYLTLCSRTIRVIREGAGA